MATAHPQPPPANMQPLIPLASGNKEAVKNQALTTMHPQEKVPDEPAFVFGAPVVLLPVELDVAVPVREFRVRNLLALAPGQLIQSQWGNGEDVPLASGDVHLAWSEFEVIDAQLAVRITRLA